MDDSNKEKLDGLSSLVQLSSIVPSRAVFVGETLLSATYGSLTLGLCAGLFGSLTPIGPLLPYMVFSSVGYSLGLYHSWKLSERRTFEYARLYPALLANAIRTEHNLTVPVHVVKASEENLLQQKMSEDSNSNDQLEDDGTTATATLKNKTSSHQTTLEEWIRGGNWKRLSFAALAAQSCRSSVDELEEHRRQQLIEEHKEKFY